jgi:predicted transposase/invertase (TIGR01784 family)
MEKKQKTAKTPQGKLVEIDGICYQVIEGKLYRYANLTLDKGFKITLGRPGSEDVLMHMLNRLLGLRIAWLEYRNTEHPGMTEDDRASRFDVYCEDEDGRGFQVEMQNWSQKHFHKRAVYYSSLLLQDQVAKARREQKKRAAKSKDWDYNYQPLYVVSILNFRNWLSGNEVTKLNDYISTYRYTDVETKEELGDGTNLIFIDLFNFKKDLHECVDLQDLWMYSIKNMFNLSECPEQLKGTEVEDLFYQSELAKMTLEQRIKIEESIMTENDIRNSIAEQIADAREEAIAEGKAEGRAEGRAIGRAIGLAEGRAEGKAEGSAEIIRQLHDKGMSAEQISQILDMDINDLKKILEN